MLPMALYRHNSETLPDRSDFSGAGARSRDQTGYSPRFRRGRRFGKVTKNGRFSIWATFFALLLLIYLSLFGAKIPSLHSSPDLQVYQEREGDLLTRWNNTQVDIVGNNDGSTEDHGSRADFLLPDSLNHVSLSTNVHHDHSGREISAPGYPRPKHRKRTYGPCEIDFSESADNLLVPKDFMQFAQFSLKYVDREEKFYGDYKYEPRFGGHQTLEERENSFYARDQILHCGFVKGLTGMSTGFDLSQKDKEYMDTCHIAVSSCIFGSSDFLRRPVSRKISSYSKKGVCFVMFVDDQTIEKLSSEGQVSDGEGYIGLWKIVVIRNLPYTDMRKTGKVPKFLSHRLFPSARFSIWIDSKLRLQADPILILEYFLWRKGSEYAISNHYDRHCVWEEVLQNKRLNKYNHTAIDEQFLFYQSDGLVKFNESDSNTPLPSFVPEGSFIVRAHSPMSNLFSCLWFNEIDRFTSRDQLSFAYTFLKLRRMNLDKPFFLNMFKDCERRAMTKLFRHRVENPPPSIAL